MTKRGQKACLNVFDYYPNFYCEFPIQVFNLTTSTQDELHDFLVHFAQNLEFSMYLLLNQKPGMKSPRSLLKEFQDRNDQYVHNIEVQYRYPIYGYHIDKKPFLKIELYNSMNIKRAASIVQSGILIGGLILQPYESHISYFMHFYGDYNLSGMEYVKITDFHIRNINSLDEDDSAKLLNSLAYYPITRFQNATLSYQQTNTLDDEPYLEVKSEESNSSFPGFKQSITPEQQLQDYSFLQNDNYLRLWHAEMPELHNIEDYLSPYQRSSTCDIELDCSCKDILNIWESDKNIIGGSSVQQQFDELKRQSVESQQELSDQFIENYITPFKTPRENLQQKFNTSVDKLEEAKHSPFQKVPNIQMFSQQSIRTVNNDEQMMKIQIDPLNRQSTDTLLKMYSQQQIDQIKQYRKSQSSVGDRSSFSFTNQNQKNELTDQLNGQQKTPDFNKSQNTNFDEEFAQYAQDIKEVRSLVNLWKEEFIRRKTTDGLPQLEKAVMSDTTRQGGFSRSIINNETVQNFLSQHLAVKYTEPDFSSITNDFYKQLDPIDFNNLKALMSQQELMQNEDDGGGGLERFQMLGFGTMRQLHQARQGKAVMKNLQQQMGQSDDEGDMIIEENKVDIDVLDIMESLKDQYEGLEEKYKNYRQGKSKYKTGKLASDIVNNKSIFDYMSPKQSKKPMSSSEGDDEIDPDLISELQPFESPRQQFFEQEDSSYINWDDLGLFNSEMQDSELQLNDLQDALISLQNSEVKWKQHIPLEEVKEEENSYSSEIARVMSEIAVPGNEQSPLIQRQITISSVEERKSSEKATEFKPRHILKGDKILRIRSPRRQITGESKHINAFFSKKDDLIQHLNEVRRIRNDRKIQLKDLRVGFTERVKQEIELDIKIQKEGSYSLINQVVHKEFIFKKKAPSSKLIRAKYSNTQQNQKYEQQFCNYETQQLQQNYPETEPLKPDKQQIKKNIINQNKNHRFVTPATQYEMKHLDSQVNVGGFEKKHFLQSTAAQKKKLSLFDIHKKFDEIYGLTVMTVEIFVVNRPGCVPNYEQDIISAIYFVVHSECAQLTMKKNYKYINGAIFNKQSSTQINKARFGSCHPLSHVTIAKNEINLMQKFIDVIREYDPDILVGYETETQSIGYICKRGETLTLQMASLLGRVPITMKAINESYYNQRMIMRQNDLPASVDEMLGQQQQSKRDPREDKKKFGYFSQKWGQSVKLNGRVIINLWRIITSEINLTNYDLDNVCFHILKKREPRYDYDTLSNWWQKGQFSLVTNTIIKRMHNMLQIIDTMNFIHRDINMANVYGIDYESIMTRGSQFRVEAIMSKITKSTDFVLLSASPQQVRDQNELEVIPLVIEPDKLFYTDPVIIVDFQSLYPSLIISYNLCYSTCLGKISQIPTDRVNPERKLGVTTIPGSMKVFFGFKADADLTEEQFNYIIDNIIIAPNLNCYVKPHIKEGILPRMLREILNTRIMVKKSMKLYEPGSTTYRMLDSRQLALKLIANVTYGYTAAGFSGRMPCVEVSDSVVSLGRATVENAIQHINKQEDIEGTRVVYGDTDSLFILCQGKSLEEAFKIGDKIAKYITSINPFPMELKFEKVYYPCVTLAKKRYCGYKLEKLGDDPILDAKGIETIRRDTVDAVQKIMDKCLRTLFVTKDISSIKDYLLRQWTKIIQGDVDFKDFIFAKEVKYGMYRNLPPGAIVVERRLQSDPGALPRYKERIPYVIVKGQGGAIDQSKLKDIVLSPEEFMARDGLLLNAEYYIKKQINPALNRIFLELFDINVNAWFDKMPKKQREQGVQSKKSNYFNQKLNSSKSVISQSKVSSTSSSKAGQNSMMIDQFYAKRNCVVCGCTEQLLSGNSMCKPCKRNQRESLFIMQSMVKNLQINIEKHNNVCLACSNTMLKGRVATMIDIEEIASNISVVPCISYQCRVFYEKMAAYKEYNYVKEIVNKLQFNQ